MLGSASVDLSGYLTDVTVDGTSVVTDGVANIPYAAYNKVGVVQVNASRGTAMSGTTISTFPVDLATVKAGVQAYQPITPAHQHESVFYGLAKASGDTTQSSSSNAIGTYTDEAKSAILDMLGIGSNEGILASKDYSTGDLFLYKGKLYKATASIAKDATIAPNTNCIQTTLIEFLKNL